jgi:transposase
MQVGDLDRKVHRLARRDVQVRRFMTVPGVGPITRTVLQDDDQRPDALQAIEKCRRVLDTQTRN